MPAQCLEWAAADIPAWACKIQVKDLQDRNNKKPLFSPTGAFFFLNRRVDKKVLKKAKNVIHSVEQYHGRDRIDEVFFPQQDMGLRGNTFFAK
jgi:hypothetical protein